MNERITIEKNTTVVDKVGNHMTQWEEYFSCFTYASTYEAEEKAGEITTEEAGLELLQQLITKALSD